VTEHVAEDGLSIESIEGGFRVAGQIDMATVDQFRQAATAAVAEGAELVMDLSGCSFLGSEGIGILIDTVKALGADGRLILRAPHGIIPKVLELSGLAKLPTVRIDPL
jgi:anti-anti-sigma factor